MKCMYCSESNVPLSVKSRFRDGTPRLVCRPCRRVRQRKYIKHMPTKITPKDIEDWKEASKESYNNILATNYNHVRF